MGRVEVIVSFAMAGGEFVERRAQALEAEADWEGLGPHDRWQVHAPCGVELSIWRSHVEAPHIGKVCANTLDLDHILFHLPFAVGEIGRWVPALLAPLPREWQVVRQDDHGTRYEMGAFTSQCEAEAIVREFETRGHKQTFWVERRGGL
jgi:hypothetical protein